MMRIRMSQAASQFDIDIGIGICYPQLTQGIIIILCHRLNSSTKLFAVALVVAIVVVVAPGSNEQSQRRRGYTY